MTKKDEIVIKIIDHLYPIGTSTGCHQLAERSLFYKGHQLPICARCTGLSIGYLAAIACAFLGLLSWKLYLFSCLVMFIDWYLQYIHLKDSTNRRRILTGIIGGYGLMSLEIMCVLFFIKICTSNK